MESTEQSRTCTASPRATVIPQLRAPDLTVAHIAPRPAAPAQKLTARPLPHDLHIPSAPYGPVSVTRAQLDQQMADAGIPSAAMDSIGAPAAWNALGGAA